MATLSVCLIVKNEAQYLDACLSSVQAVADEIIIVDTGSTDTTQEIARGFSDKVYTFKWCDDFSKARNFALQFASQDWILSIDADEVLHPASAARLPAFLKEQDSRQAIGFSFLAQAPGQQSLFTRALFPNVAEITFRGRVHETLRYQGQPLAQFYCPQFILLHQTLPLSQMPDKARIYLRLIQGELDSTDLWPLERLSYLKHLGDTYLALGQSVEASESYLAAYQSALELRLSAGDLFLPNLLFQLIPLLLAQDFASELIPTLIQTLQADYSGPEPDFYWGYYYLMNDQPQRSLSHLDRVKTDHPNLVAQIRLCQARCQLLVGETQSGQTLLLNLHRLFPQHVEVGLHLVRAYLLNHQLDLAHYTLQKAGHFLPAGFSVADYLHQHPVWTASEKLSF